MRIALKEKVDIKEDILFDLDKELLDILLKDRTSDKNIIWAIDDYKVYGNNFSATDYITIESITGKNGNVIKPRIEKSKEEQIVRIRQKAEVFTPSWICNKQNNLIDDDWFAKKNVFNKETDKGWITNTKTINFPKKSNKTWQDYVALTRMEITCGEAPYLTSRYDTVTGDYIEPIDRIGLLDRKLRIVSENTTTKEDWIDWAKVALENIYGYDWQGDNVLLARENLLYTILEHYESIFNEPLSITTMKELAFTISWNIWQMDGLKYVIPNSCQNRVKDEQLTLFQIGTNKKECIGCKKDLPLGHSGIYCKIRDWKNHQKIRFVDLIYGAS